jgi:hypothetical protein
MEVVVMWSVDHLDGGRRGARGLYELIGLAEPLVGAGPGMDLC